MKKTNYQPFWFSEALAQEDDPVATPLQDNISTDVCIIGGGYTGLWTALQLKIQKPELDIVIIDKGLCGSGASGRNGGCMLTWSTKYFSLKRLYGEEEACRLVKASEEAPFHIRDFCLKYGIDAQIRLDGTLYTATNKAQLDSIEPGIKALKEKTLTAGNIGRLSKFKPLPALVIILMAIIPPRLEVYSQDYSLEGSNELHRL